MDAALDSMFNFYQFSTGRRAFALKQTKALADVLNFARLATHCAEALEYEVKTRELESRWAGADIEPAANVQAIDVATDRTLVAIRDVFQLQATANDSVGMSARKLLQKTFPKGVQAITQSSFIDELDAIDGIVKTLNASEFAETIKETGLSRFRTILTQQAAEYRAALESPTPATTKYGAVRAARAKGNNNVLVAVAMIVGQYPTEADTETRAKLLEPILIQNEAVGQYLKSRRTVQDVDPDTGAITGPVIGETQA